MSKDSLGDRMKDHENRTRYFLPKRIFGLLRIDGKAFHTYTRGFQKPFDEELIEDMNLTAKYLCENIQGARFGYVQSDEITILFTDYYDYKTELWFDGNIQKITSVSASLATSKFNQLRIGRGLTSTLKNYVYGAGQEKDDPILTWDFRVSLENIKLAQFDSRVWSESLREEVVNCLIWRQQDAVRNSIQAVAQSLYSHKELNGKNSADLQEMIFRKGINWNDIGAGKKRGRMIVPRRTLVPTTSEAFLKANPNEQENFIKIQDEIFLKRKIWAIDDAFDFNKDKERIEFIIKLGEDQSVEHEQ